jgi:hypothetical protein
MDPSQSPANELHCWVMLANRPLPQGFQQKPEGVQIIDLCSRYYRRYTEETLVVETADPPLQPWARAEPPDYIWTSTPPDWLRLEAQPHPCNKLLATFEDPGFKQLDKTLFRLAQEAYRRA